MNAIILQDKIIENPEYIKTILEELDFEHIRDRGKYYQFPNKDGDNLTGCSVLKSSLSYQNYTRSKSGNIFTLVMDELDINFPDALKWIANKIGLTKKELNRKIRKPFGGYYVDIQKDLEEPETSMKTYPSNYLEKYYGYNMMWYNDRVDFDTQEKFHLGYDLETNSILIPIYNVNGELVGCKARRNDTKCELSERWWAFIPFQKTNIVYGYHENYQNIIEKDLCILSESEKGCAQLDSMNCHLGLGTLGHNISDVQAKYIKGLKTSRIIVGYDEGIEEDIVIEECKKLVVNNKIFKNQVGYIFDRENKYLAKDSKNSPYDLGKEVFDRLIKECVYWIN